MLPVDSLADDLSTIFLHWSLLPFPIVLDYGWLRAASFAYDAGVDFPRDILLSAFLLLVWHSPDYAMLSSFTSSIFTLGLSV